MELVRIDSKNVWDIVNLSVCEEQKPFVASNAESIIEAYVTKQDGGIALPFGLYENDIPVGFVMLGYGTNGDEDEPAVAKNGYCLWRLMIDKAFQKQGLGGRALEEILEYVGTNPCGPAFIAYYNEDMNDLSVEIGFPVAKEIAGKGDIELKFIPAGKKAVGFHKGTYQDLSQLYEKLVTWIGQRGYEPTGVVYEYYYNSPENIPESELLTKVEFLLK